MSKFKDTEKGNNLSKTSKSKAEIYNFEDYIMLPEGYECDTYIDLSQDISDIWKYPKPDLKLVQ